MTKNSPKIPLLVSLTVFLLACLAFLFLYRAIDRNNRVAEKREAEWQTEAKKRNEINILDNAVKMIEEERAELETHFAQSSDIVPFLDTIEGLAEKVGVEAEVTSVDIAKDKSGLLVGMKSSGGFSGLYKFLTLLENSPYELEFIGTNMSKEKGEGGGWSAVFKIKLLSFVP